MSKTFLIDANSKRVTIINKDFKSNSELPKGFYKVVTVEGFMGTSIELHTSDEPVLPKSSEKVADNIFDYSLITKFFSEKNALVHEELNLKQKMGILLYGIQGTGKTTTCLSFSRKMVRDLDARVFIVGSIDELTFATNFIKEANRVNKFFSIVILDESEYWMKNYESVFKNILDGSESPDRTLFLFTTNYISRIPDAIKDRPSRIKFCKEIKPFQDELEIYTIANEINSNLSEEIRINDENLKSIVKTLSHRDNTTLDNIKDEIINSIIYQ